ncbi:hypothetical protein [Phaffia rhodozyma]|uniref:Uncharacterized protein n=1 Tax=Phaffia rhodozyma TaxID=264483 RepID=A0A0F7SFN3_PHARH|nr:hypothetical protein [Phaffia rhodozyma]
MEFLQRPSNIERLSSTYPTRAANDPEERVPLLGPSSDMLASTMVYPLIHEIRKDVIKDGSQVGGVVLGTWRSDLQRNMLIFCLTPFHIGPALSHTDTPLNWEQLQNPETSYTIVRPLTEKLLAKKNHATVFCLMINRVQFIRLASTSLSLSVLSQSRATLCELLAIRLLRAWSERTIELATVLLTPWDLYQGCSDVVRQKLMEEEGEDGQVERVGNALEMAIISRAKRLIKCPSAQKVIHGIWTGRVVYQASNQHAIIAEIRAFLEFWNFLILFVLFVIVLETSDTTRVNVPEWLFIIYAAGFSLDKLAGAAEHGMQVYSANLWNGFDLAFVGIFLSYLSLRIYGLSPWFGSDNQWAATLGIDMLAIGACLMFPRLVFVTLSDNLMILAMRSMIIEFSFLMFITVFCFLGFCYALYTLAEIPATTISWWMLDIWFGLDATGFNEATNFHPVFGPLVITSWRIEKKELNLYACLSNTLILTVLVAILSKTFADISQDATAEAMFRRAVTTIEGAKADAVFSYQAPFNLLAVAGMIPLKPFLSPRWFHKLNVAFIRISAFPILICISLYERGVIQKSLVYETSMNWLEKMAVIVPKRLHNLPLIEGLVGTSSEIEHVFEIEEECGGWDESSDDISDDGWDVDDSYPEDLPSILKTEPQSIANSSNNTDAGRSTSNSPSAVMASDLPSAATDGQSTRHVVFPNSSPHPNHHPKKRQESIDGLNRVHPSPLARLFVAPPIRGSFSSMSSLSSSMPGGKPVGIHRRAMSMSNPTTLPRTIPENKQASFPSGYALSKSLDGPRTMNDRTGGSFAVGDASDVLNEQELEPGVKLELEDRVKKVEEKLELEDRVKKVEEKLELEDRVKKVEEKLETITGLLETILKRLPGEGGDSTPDRQKSVGMVGDFHMDR